MSKSSGGRKFPRRRTGATPEAVINIRTYRLTVVKRGGGQGGGARYADIKNRPLHESNHSPDIITISQRFLAQTFRLGKVYF